MCRKAVSLFDFGFVSLSVRSKERCKRKCCLSPAPSHDVTSDSLTCPALILGHLGVIIYRVLENVKRKVPIHCVYV